MNNLFWNSQLTERLIQSINVWVNACDSRLNILIWNKTAEHICGYSAEEVIGHSQIWDWLYPDVAYRQYVVELASGVFHENNILGGHETLITCKSGETKTIEWYSSRMLNDKDGVEGFVTFGYDVTDKKIAQKALKEAHDELHVLYDIASITSEFTNLQMILDRSLEHIVAITQSVGGAIYLKDENHPAELSLMAQYGLPKKQLPERVLVQQVYREAKIRRIMTASNRIFLGVPMRAKGSVLGVICIVESQTKRGDAALLTSIADQIGIAVQNADLYRQSQRLAVAEERRRLARDLHDSVTQSLYSLTLFAEAGQRLLHSGDLDRVDAYLSRLTQTAQDSLKEMRLLLHELRPWQFEEGRLIENIQHRLDAVERRAGLTAYLVTDSLPALPPHYEDNLYHITMEALNNALKHASAGSVTVQISCDNGILELAVTDDGVGFYQDTAFKSSGMGLDNMRERAEELQGTFSIQPDSQGTRIEVQIPIPSDQG